MKNTLKPYTANLFLLLTYLLCGITIDCFSQVSPQGLTSEMLLPQFSNLTPEAASLGKYGAFQVSEYSGAANISIPLYTVKSGDISFPISLYYEGTGIKVEQDATFVGLGWNLSYGGMISHIICGHNDFHDPTNRTNYWKNYWANTDTFPQNQPCEIYMPKWVDKGGNEYLLYDYISKGYDCPDIFRASFCGHNIAFIIDARLGKGADGQDSIVILSDSQKKYRISYKIGKYNFPSAFTITDDKGISYVFNAYSENCNQYVQADSYYLEKIYDSDGACAKSIVSIEYEQECFYYTPSRPIQKFHEPTTQHINNNYENIPTIDNFSSFFDNIIHGTEHAPYIGCNDNGGCDKVYPKRIITALDTIEFTKEPREDIKGAKSISGITVKSKNGDITRNIRLTYDYYLENPEKPFHSYSHKRLKLTGVTIDEQKYQFEYDNQKLPSFASYSKDYWGYYNGANPQAYKFFGCSPAYTILNDMVRPVEHLDGSNRLASEELCNVGMLKRIIYPTGGYTDYEFEAHRFNDKYYYPDASHKISFPPSVLTIKDGEVTMVGTMTDSICFVAKQEKYYLQLSYHLNNTAGNLNIIIRDSSKKYDLYNLTYFKKNENFTDSIPLSLTKGDAYIITINLIDNSQYHFSTYAQCSVKHDSINTNVAALPTTRDENGGYSIGGGLRIKTIKNYDSNSTYLNGVKYEYYGGKLLSPTVQLEKHYIDFYYNHIEPNVPVGITDVTLINARVAFKYANTEPSYPYICSLGIPTIVGYDTVVKSEEDKNGNIQRKTVLNYFNYGYVTNDSQTNSINNRMQNSFYFNSYYSDTNQVQGHLNGKIKNEIVYSGTGKKNYQTSYEYSCKKLGSVLYPKCFPKFLSNFQHVDGQFDLAFFRKFITWSYLTKKDETFYDANGNKTTSRVTTYTYDDSNYQVSQQTISDGQNTESVRYWYPLNSGNPSTGLSYLINRNCLSEVTGVDTYKNGVFTGGSKFNYTTYNNLDAPAVKACFSILPNSGRTNVLEMKVTVYDSYGNIREYEKKDGTPVTILWSYYHQYPVMEIVGKRYEDIKSDEVVFMEDPTRFPTESRIRSVHNTIRQKNPDAHVTAYIYTPWHTISRIISPNGYEVNYGYDSFGRLIKVGDDSGVLQKYQYNYKIR